MEKGVGMVLDDRAKSVQDQEKRHRWYGIGSMSEGREAAGTDTQLELGSRKVTFYLSLQWIHGRIDTGLDKMMIIGV